MIDISLYYDARSKKTLNYGHWCFWEIATFIFRVADYAGRLNPVQDIEKVWIGLGDSELTTDGGSNRGGLEVDQGCYSSVKFESRHTNLALETHILIQYRVAVNAPKPNQTSRYVSRSVRLDVEHLLGLMTRFWSIRQSLDFVVYPRTQYTLSQARKFVSLMLKISSSYSYIAWCREDARPGCSNSEAKRSWRTWAPARGEDHDGFAADWGA